MPRQRVGHSALNLSDSAPPETVSCWNF